MPPWLVDLPLFSKQPNIVGVNVGKTDNGYHVGILYYLEDEKTPNFLHLGWHKKLYSNSEVEYLTYYPKYKWIKVNCNDIKASIVSAWCRRIYKTKRFSIAYGIYFDETVRFVEKEDDFVLEGKCTGLSCSTFVLTIFNSTGIDLISEKEWPQREDDDKRHAYLIDKLEKTKPPVDKAHIEANKDSLAKHCIRYRPEEIGGATSAQKYPASFKYSEETGKQIIAVLA